MSRRPATFTQADVARAIRAAKQAGAVEVVVRSGEATILIRISPSTASAEPLAESGEVVL